MNFAHIYRSLARDRAYSVTVLLTLAVTIAANAAIFAIVNSVLLRPLPVPRAEEIVLMSNSYPKATAVTLGYSGPADYYDRRRDVKALGEQAMYQFAGQTVEIGGRAERIDGMRATPSLFRVLEVQPATGRAFTDAEGELGAEDKVILSHGLWMRLFGGDREAIGKTLRLSGRPFTITGVMPKGFTFLDPDIQLWIPLAFTAEQKEARHNNSWHHIGRLRPGATIEQVDAQIKALNAANLDRFPAFRQILINAGFETVVEPLINQLIRDVRPAIYLLWGAAGVVLLIGALNIGNLVLARQTLRRREYSTRMALGAGRTRLFAAALTENLALALSGGVVGVGLGAALIRILPAAGFDRLPRAQEIAMNPVVIALAVLLSAVVGLVMTISQAGAFADHGLAGALQENSRGGTSGTGSRLTRRVLVVAQFGLAFVLVAGSGALLQSFRELMSVDPGFRREGLTTAWTSAPRQAYPDDAALNRLSRRILTELRAAPGAQSATVTDSIPYGGDYNDTVIMAEGYRMKAGESLISPRQVTVSAGYFEAMKIPLLSGRYFDERDSETATRVVIVDERLARRFWGNASPLGRRIYLPSDGADLMKITPDTKLMTVVGVVRFVRLEDLTGDLSPNGAYYFPYTQNPKRGLGLIVRSPGNAAQLLRAAVARVDPGLAVYDMRTMEERTRLSLSTRRTSLLVAGSFAGLALALAALGIYGVLAYLVAQRSREIGIRVALGSTNIRIVRLVAGEGLTLSAAGLALGGVGMVALRRALESQLYGVGAMDPRVILAAVAVLTVIALLACLLPARRATALDPVRVLSAQ